MDLKGRRGAGHILPRDVRYLTIFAGRALEGDSREAGATSGRMGPVSGIEPEYAFEHSTRYGKGLIRNGVAEFPDAPGVDVPCLESVLHPCAGADQASQDP